ncbi:MAG: hypothetical protein IPN69_03080 [Acidobacteria bacterium]|nr:hypothetical protein [Acidobacteriota bacterium]
MLFFIPERLPRLAREKDNGSNIPTTSKELPPEINPNGIYHSEVTLADGSTGAFDIYVLDKKYVWETGSESVVEGLGDLSQKNKWKTAFSERLQELLKNANEIIVVGTADIRSATERENARAGNRSRTLLNVVTEIRGNGQTAFNWNLGQWKGSRKVSFEDQRRLIFIEVVRRSAGADLKEGVRKALEEHQTAQPIFTDLLYSYSKSNAFEIR